jgi:catechol 2,3-dioxygenase-like lactoylglutathione lyase family enzyme
MADVAAPVLHALDHVNIRTAEVDRLATFYGDVLGLTRGPRPAFPFGGAWLYCGAKAVIHLVDASDAPPHSYDPLVLGLSHFAFSATGLAAFVARLQRMQLPHRVAQLPDRPLTQVNLRDPDGNSLHVDFTDESTTP